MRDLGTDEIEEFMVVLAEMMDIDAGHISLASPLGRALADRKVGDEVQLRLPHHHPPAQGAGAHHGP